jgi:hypothetical protein
MVFITTQLKMPSIEHFINNSNDKIIGRLYAVEVKPDAENENDRLNVTWNYTYFGASQASPTLINDTIYFDGFNKTSESEYRDPHIYAVYTNGTERWNKSVDNYTAFSFSMDPRGGFWYEYSGERNYNSGKLVRFSEENGSILEEINGSKLAELVNDSDNETKNELLYPCSAMTICGTSTDPIMIVSVNHDIVIPGKWVVAINLSNNKSLLWKAPIKSLISNINSERKSLAHINFAGGQYTILNESNEYRVLFGTTFGGVMAIGSYPDCWFDGPIDYQFTDSSNDINPFKDTVNVSFNLKTSLSQDKATVKVILHPLYVSNPANPCYPILYRYRAEKEFIVTPEGTSGSIELSLPKGAPEAIYAVHVVLLNSSGDIKIDTLNEILGNGLEKLNDLLETLEYDYDVNLTEKLDAYSTEISDVFHVNVTELLNRYPLGVIKDFLMDILSIYVFNDDKVYPNFEYLYPPNDPPHAPDGPEGPSIVYAREEYEYKTRTTDPNEDDIEYKWRFNLGDLLLNYKKWSEPCDSGEYYTQNHSWITCGPRLVLVKARDTWHSPNVQSEFSPAKEVLVLPHCWFSAPSEQIVDEPVQFNGYMYGAEASQWLWDFDLSRGFEEMSSTTEEAYSESNTYTVTLKVIDTKSNTYTFSRDIEIKYLVANFTSNNAKTNETVWFNDTSLVHGNYNIVNWTWDFDDGNISYEEQNIIHYFELPGVYNVSLTIMDNEEHIDVFCMNIVIDDDPPVVLDVPSWPFRVKPGNDITIYADVVDSSSGVDSVMLNISYPDLTWQEVFMEPSDSSSYDYEYVFSDTDRIGEYFYSITAEDNAGNSVCYAGFSFSSSPLAFIPVTPYYGAQPYSYIPVNVATIETMQHYSFANFNNDVTVWMPMDVITDVGQPLDVSGYDNNGIIHGEAVQTDNGFFGKGFIFDGMEDYVEITDSDSSLDFTSSGCYTWSFWLKNAGPGDSSFGLLSKASGVNDSGFNFCLNSTGDNAFFVVSKPDAGEMQYSDNVNLNMNNNTWMLLTVVYNGSSGWDVYANGSKLDSFSFSVDSDIDSPYFLGVGRNATGDGPNLFFNGSFDDIVMFTRALGQSEINSLYDASAYQYSNNFTGLVDGMYNFTGCAGYLNGDANMTETRSVTIDTYPPLISNISNNPDIVGFGDIVTINADVVENGTGILMTLVNISYPDNNSRNYSLHCVGKDIYQCNFSDTWVVGQYNYTVWALDNVGNMLSSGEHCFNVSAMATIGIATLKDSYGSDEYINLTDPPNPLENLTLVDRGLTWNEYYDSLSGSNVLEAFTGPVNYQEDNGSWTPIDCSIEQLSTNHPAYNYGYRAGNEQGLYNVYFKPNVQSNWPVAFAYNKSDDPTTHVIRSKLVGVGYLDPQSNWTYEYLQNVQSSQGILDSDSIVYEDVFPGTDVVWTYENIGLKENIILSNTTKTLLQSHPPSDYGLGDSSYLVFITELDYQNLVLYNTSGILNGNVTVSDGWIAFKDDALGYFKCALPIGEAYEFFNESVRQKLVYRVLQYNNNFYLLSGLKITDLFDMSFPVVIDPTLAVYSSSSDGYLDMSSNNDYNTAWSSSTGTVHDSLDFLRMGQYKFKTYYYIYRGFLFFNTSSIPANANITNATLSLYKYTDYSSTDFDIVVQNGQPTYPHDPLQSGDFNKNYYSGNGGSLNTLNFVNGRNNISLTNYNWINKEGMTKLCIRSSREINGTAPTGNEHIAVFSSEKGAPTYAPSLIITYQNHSKISNTGFTNITGYLLIQVQFKDGEEWVVDNDTVNETKSRTIKGGGLLLGEELALDTIFNDLVNTNDLTHGDGLYRVYAAFRDPDGDVLVCDDDSLLEAWYEFTVVFE